MTKSDDWWRCLNHLIAGDLAAALDGHGDEDDVNVILNRVGLAVADQDVEGTERRRLLVPARSDLVDALFAGTPYDGYRYWDAIRGGPGAVVIKSRAAIPMRIGNTEHSVVLVDLAAWQEWRETHRPAVEPGIAAEELRQFIERIERLEEDKRAVQDDLKDVYADAKGRGFHLPAIRTVVRLRAKDPATREEEEAMVDLYKNALGMI